MSTISTSAQDWQRCKWEELLLRRSMDLISTKSFSRIVYDPESYNLLL